MCSDFIWVTHTHFQVVNVGGATTDETPVTDNNIRTNLCPNSVAAVLTFYLMGHKCQNTNESHYYYE